MENKRRQTNKSKKQLKNKIQTNKIKKGGVNNPGITNVNTNNGFTATLIKKPVTQSQKKQTNICRTILKIGKNTTKKNFMPSQLPKLTGLTQKYVSKQTTTKQEKDKEDKEDIDAKMLEEARKVIKSLREEEEKQKRYEKAILQAKSEYDNK